jgi:ABC-type transporter Mla subunit MlaD
MPDEETQRIMQFILEQQAQLTATVGRLSEKVDRTADGISSLLAIAELHEREIAELRESVNTTSASVNAMRESVSAVDERGRETDERLNALINTVERYISERRNGQA